MAAKRYRCSKPPLWQTFRGPSNGLLVDGFVVKSLIWKNQFLGVRDFASTVPFPVCPKSEFV